MSTLIKVGDAVPAATFATIPYQLDETLATCGSPSGVKTESWKGKKVILFSVPGAFTSTCHEEHLPGYLEKYDEFKEKGVDVIGVFSANDPFVMSAWAKVSGLKDKILSLSDPGAAFAKELGWELDLNSLNLGLGIRIARGAIVIDDLKVTHIAREPGPGVTVSGADAVLAAL